MCQSDLHDFLQGLPKCEHHVHLEGCLTPELIFELAQKNQIALPDEPAYASPASLTQRYGNFSSLDDFLRFYFLGMTVLVDQSDFASLAWAYFQQAQRDGVHHAEVFFDPQVHVERGVAYSTVVEGFAAGCQRAERELGVTTRLILCFVRHLPVESAAGVYAAAQTAGHFDAAANTVHGLGWSSTEVGPPKDMFRGLYADAAAQGIRLTAHAGEEGDPSYIETALELGAQRIDHGIRLVEDAALMQGVASEEVLLTVCPISNVQLKCVESVAQVPIRRFLEAGVQFSINSDDPAYFGGYVLDNYCAVQEAFGLSVLEWKTIAQMSVRGSWVDDARKEELLSRIDEHVGRHLEVVV